MLPTTDTRDWGLRDRFESRILPFAGGRCFSHSVAVLWEGDAVQARENLVLRHERQ